MCVVSLDSVWAGCPYALWYVAALTITLFQSDPACHYLDVCNVVRGFCVVIIKEKKIASRWYLYD